MIDDFSPIRVGDTGAPFAPAFTTLDSSGNIVPYSLSGVTISMIMIDADGNQKVCSGPWTIDDAVNGKAHYDYQSSDVNAAGNWKLYTTLTKNGKPLHAQIKLLEIIAIS